MEQETSDQATWVEGSAAKQGRTRCCAQDDSMFTETTQSKVLVKRMPVLQLVRSKPAQYPMDPVGAHRGDDATDVVIEPFQAHRARGQLGEGRRACRPPLCLGEGCGAAGARGPCLLRVLHILDEQEAAQDVRLQGPKLRLAFSSVAVTQCHPA